MGVIDAFQEMSIDVLRKEVISMLKKAYADGRISVDLLEQRLTKATGASAKDELLALVSDIPPAKAGSGGAEAHSSWNLNNQGVRRNQSLVTIIGSSERVGRWKPAQLISCYIAMGSIKLDFREALFPPEGVKVTAGCLMGSLEIIVPPGINVEVSGLPLVGSFENKSGDGDVKAPLITVSGLAVMGSITVKRKNPKKPGKKGSFFGSRKRRRS